MAQPKATAKQQEVQRIMDTISKAVAQHRLKPGQRLVEAQIVESLNANRNHVQTALQRLALRKIVNIEPNKGAAVAKPSAQEAKEIFATRRVIERGVVESITPQIIAKNKKRIDARMKAERKATSGNDRRAIVHELSEFHRMLSEICQNSVLHDIFENLMVRSSLIVALYQRNDVPSCASDEHQQVLNALEQGDTLKAVAVMLEHLDELEAQLVLDEPEDEDLDLNQIFEGL
ncbi:GntR family transcriptional regulator [Catenovulum sp. 2E275]|uniref:GntR family transcriptional regulator n=1 Tax=Catenovulum sp. 2E275 TaxID=2980497 RepID=UPI0021D2E435|nr:GntR family transcriptional regulator [Catenovulum sp. 2E275]MCU4677400.1 GntR family transcriptional regulator [Catenovulum sp. 2E275]